MRWSGEDGKRGKEEREKGRNGNPTQGCRRETVNVIGISQRPGIPPDLATVSGQCGLWGGELFFFVQGVERGAVG